MKCLILAGGRGERLWPLSRKNYPKQFIQIQKNHSIFQETVARNIPYCDEFIIVTSYEYRFVIESQMVAFQGVTYRCIYEEVPRKTAVAIALACLELQPSELVFVVPSDQLIKIEVGSSESGLNYKDAILQAKQYALKRNIVIFGTSTKDVDQRFGWIRHIGEDVVQFVKKPEAGQKVQIEQEKVYLRNTGILLFENGIFQREIKRIAPLFYEQCVVAHKMRQTEGNQTIYSKKVLESVYAEQVENLILEYSHSLKVIICGFVWSDVGKLEDLALTVYQGEGVCVKHESNNSVVINNATDQAVLVNNVDDLMVVNTRDAVYIGKYGESGKLKTILNNHTELRPYSEKGAICYRSWGYYQQLFGEMKYRIRRVVIYPGKTIYAHRHELRSENWTVVQGNVAITLNGVQKKHDVADNIDIPVGTVHQISNIGDEDAVFVETACGEIQHEQDMISNPTTDIGEKQLGMKDSPFVKLLPAFKDYLWGGTKLRDVYGKNCDYDKIAESWELSAHPDGQSIIANGKHKGMLFGQYLERIGKEVLGWKCQSIADFPLLIKFIDAKDNLSIQVHPDDDYALEHEHQYGKNEMWYILDCEPGASLYVGFNRDVSREEVEDRVRNNTILEVLNQVPTHPGDVFFIPAGTVHAIGAGNLICEIQQSSNCTYRLYDYDRRDKYGNPRDLHLQKALDVLNYSSYVQPELKRENTGEGTVLCRCKYFETKIYEVDGAAVISVDESRFIAIICVMGDGFLCSDQVSCEVHSGDSFFVKAANIDLLLKGKMKVICSNV